MLFLSELVLGMAIFGQIPVDFHQDSHKRFPIGEKLGNIFFWLFVGWEMKHFIIMMD